MASAAFVPSLPFPALPHYSSRRVSRTRARKRVVPMRRIVFSQNRYPEPEQPERIENLMNSEQNPDTSGESGTYLDTLGTKLPSMANDILSSSLPDPARLEFIKASRALWRVGWVSWWIQLILTIIAAVILVFSFSFPGVNHRASASAVGFILAFIGVFIAFVSLFWTYSYTRLSLWLNDVSKPVEQITSKINSRLRIGMVVALVGLIVSLTGLQAIVGTLLARLLGTGFATAPLTAYHSHATAGAGGLVPGAGIVQPVDILIVQASANSMMALVTALTATIWLRSRQKKWSKQAS